MPRNKNRSLNSRGFTLLEILLALSILTMISLGVAAGLSAGIRAWESGEKNLVAFQRKRIVCERLVREISSAINLTGKLEDEEEAQMIFDGASDSLSFITTASAMSSPGLPMTLKELAIFVEPGEGLIMSESMFARSDFFDRDRGFKYVLDPDVTELQFRYYYLPNPRKIRGEETSLEGEWLDSWGPEQIEIQEVVEEDDEGSRVRERELKKRLPLAVELTVFSQDPSSDIIQQWPPLTIPLQEARILWVSYKRIPRK